MSFGSRALCVALALPAALACGTVGSDGTLPTTSQLSELAQTVDDEVQSAAAGLSLDSAGTAALPGAFQAVAGCPASSPASDGDGDGIPDDATFTFLTPPCSTTGPGGGDWAVTGTLRVQDPNGANSTAYNLTYTDLAWSFSDSAQSRTYTATRNGTRTRLGSGNAASLAVDVTIERQRPNRATATVDVVTTTTFSAATPGTLQVDEPLPDGIITIAGSLGWQRSTESWSLAVATPIPLVYDAGCPGPQRIASGRITLSGTVANQAGFLTITWTGCGVPPTRRWTDTT